MLYILIVCKNADYNRNVLSAKIEISAKQKRRFNA